MEFFLYPWEDLMDFGADFIARKELLAALVAVFSFRERIVGRLVNLFSDNSSAVQWLKKGRTANPLGNTYLACWELIKYISRCKITPKWIPGNHNPTADALSRGTVPNWLQARGRINCCDLGLLASLIRDPESAWNYIL